MGKSTKKGGKALTQGLWIKYFNEASGLPHSTGPINEAEGFLTNRFLLVRDRFSTPDL